MELQCCVQNYDWGKLGKESVVAQLAEVCNSTLAIDAAKPYAELWMGTHVNGPCFAPETDEPLSVWLARNLDSLGVDVRKEFGDDLPFLFKVLSVRKALSVQAHPNKKHAEELHRLRPDLYKDPNHKPELAVALTPFEALCGFRPMEEIKSFIADLPELQTVLGEETVKSIMRDDETDASRLKTLMQALMTQDIKVIQENLQLLNDRLEKSDDSTKSRLQFPLLKRLAKDFAGDVGCWCIYIFNYLVLEPGQSIYLGPNIPHAYLSGDCVECMACSDNVVRAGLTPKYIDVVTLVGMLSYECQSVQDVLFSPQVEDPFTRIWRPPVKDFAVAEIKIPKGHLESYNTIMRPSASILLVVSGQGVATDSLEKTISRGSVLYLKASRQLSVTSTDSTQDMIIYQAMCNVV